MTGVAWNPKQARQLAVCYANNVAEIWDLRQPMYPKQYLENAHRRSILDIAWCPHGMIINIQIHFKFSVIADIFLCFLFSIGISFPDIS